MYIKFLLNTKINRPNMKCAEIHRNDNGYYYFICYDCGNEYESSDSIIQHIEKSHFTIDKNPKIEYKTETHIYKLDIQHEEFLQPPSTNEIEEEEIIYEESTTYSDDADGCITDDYLEYENDNDHGDGDVIEECDNNQDSNNDCTSTTAISQNYYQLHINILQPQNKLASCECDICGRKFKQKSQIINHMKIHSIPPGTYGCERCDRKFQSENHLETHRKNSKNSALESNQSFCEVCNEKYTYMCEYKKHFVIFHQNEGSSECLICDKSYSNSMRLNRHMQGVHIDRPFECEICHSMIRGKGNLSQHHKTQHTNERPFVCSVCGKTFKFAHYLRLHMRFHNKEKQYTCSLCDKTFYTAAKANEHMKTHTNARQFKCTKCYKRFMSEDNLQQHMIRHTFAEKSVCLVCGKEFGSGKTLRQHQQLHSAVKRYGCRHCDSKFAQLAGRRCHERNKHKIHL